MNIHMGGIIVKLFHLNFIWGQLPEGFYLLCGRLAGRIQRSFTSKDIDKINLINLVSLLLYTKKLMDKKYEPEP
jgi:hypothetical protein